MSEVLKQENQENEYSSLKQGLLDGSKSFSEVKDKLFELDQTPPREAFEENLAFLLDPEIIEFVNKNSKNLEKYHEILCLTELHVAQRLAGNNSPEAVDHFQKALESARESKDDR